MRNRCLPAASKMNVVGGESTEIVVLAAGLASISISTCATGKIAAPDWITGEHPHRVPPNCAEMDDGGSGVRQTRSLVSHIGRRVSVSQKEALLAVVKDTDGCGQCQRGDDGGDRVVDQRGVRD